MNEPYNDEGIARLLAILADRPALAPRCPTIAPRSLWLSKATGRRGTVLWASGARVSFSFDENDPMARREYDVPDFLRLYSEAR